LISLLSLSSKFSLYPSLPKKEGEAIIVAAHMLPLPVALGCANVLKVLDALMKPNLSVPNLDEYMLPKF
jgi:hypothetical protein